jgi:hypothetical protein
MDQNGNLVDSQTIEQDKEIVSDLFSKTTLQNIRKV